MIRLTINKLLPALVVLLLFASCEQEEFEQEDNRCGDGEKIRFEVAVEAITATFSAKETRVATSTDGNYTTTWTNGDAIGVYIVKGDGGLHPSGNWVNNMKVTYNDGVWTPTIPLYYPTDGDPLHFYAYYPYNEGVTNALNMSISGLTDQSTAANLSKSDLLFASNLNVAKTTNPVQLNFSHVLTMVELSVTGGGTGAQMSSGVVVTLEGCKPDASFNLSTGKANVANGASVQSIKMYRVEQSGDADYLTKYTYRALVPTQAVFSGAELFRFSQKQGSITRALSHTLTYHVELHPGRVKPYKITLHASSTHTYAVGDYYPYKGFPILGVVFQTSNNGKNGKIVSLDEVIDVKWGDPAVDEQAAGVGSIRDMNDGQAGTKNLIAKRKDQSDFATTYGAFNWIYQTKNNGDVNGMWYMPAINELESFWNVWNVDRTGFSAKLTAAGYGSIWEDCYYRSSTESNNPEYADFFQMQSGTNFNSWYNKAYSDYSFRGRAIAKF